MNNFLRETGKNLILERINQIKNNEIDSKNDILTAVLEKSSNLTLLMFRLKNDYRFYFTTEDDKIDLEIMIDDYITFFIAGQETTANTLGKILNI